MKGLEKYNIDIFKLNNGKHEYDFEVGDAFFEEFENSLVDEGKVNVHLCLDKRETFIEAVFKFSGSVVLTCDRSLELFDFPLQEKGKLIFKYGDEEMEVDDEISIITKSTQRINIAQYIYDTICLSIPYKKLHPRFADEDDDSEGSLIYRDEAPKDADDTAQENETIDPRWEILKNLKNN